MENELVIRLTAFFGIFLIMALWEVAAPRRTLTVSKTQRWISNILIVILNTLLIRVLFPTAAVGMALWVGENGWGILNILGLHTTLEIIIALVILDFAIYLQHVMVHAIPVLWRLHRVHHADLDFDVTTGARFHPIEIILSMLIKFTVIIVLGPSAIAVLLFEVILNAMSMFNHSNVRIPKPIDQIIRSLFVTPDMHRVHHSIEENEANSNFGFNLSIWDRLFGTYLAQPQAGHKDMTIGISTFREEKYCINLPGMLALPFKGKITSYALNRRSWQENK